MLNKSILIFTMLFISSWANADLFDIQLSDDSARFSYAAEIFGGQFGPTDLDMGVYFDQDKDNLLHLGLLVRNDTLDNPLIIGIGTRFYYADVGKHPGQTPTEGAVITIGGEVLYIPDAFNGFGLGLYGFIAPSVTTFIDADGFSEFGAIISYSVSEQARFYIGYRSIELNVENAEDIDIDSGFIYGFNLRF